MSTTPTLIDLFAGCGGGSLGFIAAGFEVRAAVEINRDAADAYRANINVHPIIDDIRHVRGDELLSTARLKYGQCTLLFGCPPCQTFTILRRGARPTRRDVRRNSLLKEYLRLVKEVHPRYLAFENVPGMLEGRWQPHFRRFIDGVGDLGYSSVSRIIDAADYGVPQRRRRLLVIASRVTVPSLPRRSFGGSRPHRTVEDAIGDLPELASGDEDECDEFHRARTHSTVALRRLRAIPEGGGRHDLPPRLELRCHRGHRGHHDVYGRMSWDRPAPTLTSGCTNITRGRFAHPDQHRAITLREALRIQTFPDRAALRGNLESMALQVGNAVPPRLAERIGRHILGLESHRLSRRR